MNFTAFSLYPICGLDYSASEPLMHVWNPFNLGWSPSHDNCTNFVTIKLSLWTNESIGCQYYTVKVERYTGNLIPLDMVHMLWKYNIYTNNEI